MIEFEKKKKKFIHINFKILIVAIVFLKELPVYYFLLKNLQPAMNLLIF